MQLLIFFGVCIASVSASSLFMTEDPEFSELWKIFKTVFNKSYLSDTHEALRHVVFGENVRYIKKHNSEADLGHHSFLLGVNEFTDFTNSEFRKVLLGYRLNGTHKRKGTTFLPPSNVALPISVDWRTRGYVTSVKNQGHCGSCWAFSATGSLEGQHFKKTGTLVSLSEQNLIDCSQEFGNDGCHGGEMDSAFKYIKVNHGLDTEASYPYRETVGSCEFKRENVGATVTGFVDIPEDNEDALQTAVATVGPISVGVDSSRLSFQFYHSGVYDEAKCSSTSVDHGMLIVGYGVENGKEHWLVKNSWGSKWGEMGYIKMSRNKHNQCGIASMASYPLV